MKRNWKWYFTAAAALFLILFFLNAATVTDKTFEQTNQLTLMRNVGHLVLKSTGDTLSRVLPVKQLQDKSYELSFEHVFLPNPDSILVIAMQQLKAFTPFAVELWNIDSNTMVHSFVVSAKEDEMVLPCLNRPLPLNKYKIVIRFANSHTSGNSLFAGAIVLFFIAGAFAWYKTRSPKKQAIIEADPSFITVGNIKFYPQQQTIVYETAVTELTSKENHVLLLLAQSPNEVVERSRLQKEVWEDQGVIVTRSLDIFISRLRKKLSADGAVKIVNVHGKGYKLEVHHPV